MKNITKNEVNGIYNDSAETLYSLIETSLKIAPDYKNAYTIIALVVTVAGIILLGISDGLAGEV